jgi:hypothetical protein
MVDQRKGRELVLFEEDPSLCSCVLDAIDANGYLTLDEVGQHMGITRERVRQIMVRALWKVKHRIHAIEIRQHGRLLDSLS